MTQPLVLGNISLMTYENITTNDPNPAKRWLQKRRFSDALRIWEKPRHNERLHVLDFGGGNGELLRQLEASSSICATLYEPTPALMAEAKQRLSSRNNVKFVESTAVLDNATYDYVFCLEVFEHLPGKETVQALAEIQRLLKPGGLAIIGVPIEIYFPALVKGIFRLSRRYGEFDARLGNIFSAMIGQPPSQRPTAEIATGFNYHFAHLGFDYRCFQHQIAESFLIENMWFSPFPVFGSMLNSEVYYLLRKAKASPAPVLVSFR
jgi:SAM-dependent methyltransferase